MTDSGAPWSEAAAEAAEVLGIPPGAVMTDEQAAEFRERFAEAMDADWKPGVLPQRKPLTKDEVRQILRECVTVVKPGETLVLRVNGLTPWQVREYQDWVRAWHENGDLPFPVVILIGDELGVAEAGEVVVKHEVKVPTDAEFAEQLHRVIARDRKVNPGKWL